MKKVLIAFIAFASFSAMSCATILTGTKDTISFNTTPKDASVLIDGMEKCTTPCSVPVKRSLSSQTVQFTKDGYQPKTIELERKFNAVSLVNIILGGIIGIGVDAATGSLMKYSTKAYNVEMKKDTK